MSIEQQLLAGYEKAVASLVAHASLHAPSAHEEGLREVILRGERALCERCRDLRGALLHAAEAWRKASKKQTGKSASESASEHDLRTSIARLGLTG